MALLAFLMFSSTVVRAELVSDRVIPIWVALSTCKKFSDDLKNASRDNPKHFWKILGGHKRKKQPNIEINNLYEFFKDLNTKGLDEQQSTTLQNELPNDSNVHSIKQQTIQ